MMKTHALSHSFKNLWGIYEKRVHLFNKRLSKTNAHELRIAAHRLETSLMVASGIDKSKASEKLLRKVRDTRKLLSPLRDLHVGRDTLKEMDTNVLDDASIKHYLNYFTKKIKKLKRKQDELHIPLHKQVMLAKKVNKNLFRIETRKGPIQISEMLLNSEAMMLIIFRETMHLTNPQDRRSFHRLRIQLKRLRYLREVLVSVNVDNDRGLESLKVFQRKMGEILDRRILIETLINLQSHHKHLLSPKSINALKKYEQECIKLARSLLIQIKKKKVS